MMKKIKQFCELEEDTWTRYKRHIIACGAMKGISYDLVMEQVDFSYETFLDEFQIKIIDDHLVKIKWEISCPFVGCYHPLYASWLLDPSSGRGWEEPYHMYQQSLDDISEFIDSEMD